MKPVTYNESAELRTLARRINAREEAIEGLKKRALDSAADTIKEALLQGQDLVKLKHTLPHGQWLTWLSLHCPKIGERTAQVYMRLASNPQRAADFISAGSIRQALALLEEPAGKTETQTKQWPPYLEAIGRLSKLVGYVERFPVDQWPEEGLEKFRGDLEPIAKRLWPEKFA